MTQLPCPDGWRRAEAGEVHTRLQGQKGFSFEILSKADLHPIEFSLQTAPLSRLCRLVKPLVGTTP